MKQNCEDEVAANKATCEEAITTMKDACNMELEHMLEEMETLKSKCERDLQLGQRAAEQTVKKAKDECLAQVMLRVVAAGALGRTLPIVGPRTMIRYWYSNRSNRGVEWIFHGRICYKMV